jgi:hypothetical protein
VVGVTTGARDLVRHCVEACCVILITTVNFWFMFLVYVNDIHWFIEE